MRRGCVATLTVVAVAVAALIPAGISGAAAAATSRPDLSALAAVPASYLTWYKEAARTCHGLGWEVLAAIGTMESDNGRSLRAASTTARTAPAAPGPA